MSHMKYNIKAPSKKAVAILCILAYLISLIPLYYISRYNVPSADDYSCVNAVGGDIFTQTNLINYIIALIKHTINSYFTWQGTFSAYFFGPLLSLEHYWIGPVLLLSAFSFGLWFLLKSVLGKLLGIQKENVLILFSIIATMCIQPLPSVAEGFYWWSGAFLYMGFFSLAMITLALFISVLAQRSGEVKRRYYLILWILFFLIGGGNYPTALSVSIVLIFILFLEIIQKGKKIVFSISCCAFSIMGLLFNVFAPGNSLRRAQLAPDYHFPISRMLTLSFKLGFQFFRTYFTLYIALGMLLALPVFLNGMRNTSRKFRCPMVFSFFTFCAFCALFAPIVYTTGWIGPARYMNIVYIGFVLLVYANEAYYVGWLCAKANAITVDHRGRDVFEAAIVQEPKKYLVWVFIASFAIAWMFTRPNFFISETTAPTIPFATRSAVESIQTGQAKCYFGIYKNRVKILQDESVGDAILEPYPEWAKPRNLFFNDITEDPADWCNISLASYYGKTTVRLIPSQEQ